MIRLPGQMTHEQIIGNVVISVVVGLFLIIIGAILQPLLKKLWQRMNRAVPLTPQTRGQLLYNRTLWEAEIERLDYLSTHRKDLFLLLIQLMMVVLLTIIAAFWLYGSGYWLVKVHP
jgi:Trk-type K+ transport system membrane component